MHTPANSHTVRCQDAITKKCCYGSICSRTAFQKKVSETEERRDISAQTLTKSGVYFLFKSHNVNDIQFFIYLVAVNTKFTRQIIFA